MIGVFDSGRGAYNAAEYLRAALPKESLKILTDPKNAPFGTKSEAELIPILRSGLSKLRNGGADPILLACCTMCTVLPRLEGEERRGVFGIIEPTARAAAALTKNKKIALVATERTVTDSAFERAVRGISDAELIGICASELVGIAERGGPVSREDAEKIRSVCDAVGRTGADVLILGCTHFSTLKKQIKSALPTVTLVDSARIGAMALTSYIKIKEKKKWQNTEEDESTRR